MKFLVKWSKHCICIALAFSLLSFSGTVSAHAQPPLIPVTSLLNSDGTIGTATGIRGTLDLRGWNVTLDSKRGPVLTSQEQSLAVPQAQPDQWSALPHHGLNNQVNAIAVLGTDLYLGGTFTMTADSAVTNLNHIAKFDGTNWSALSHNGLNGEVIALAVDGSIIFVGGSFSQTADTVVTNLNRVTAFHTTIFRLSLPLVIK